MACGAPAERGRSLSRTGAGRVGATRADGDFDGDGDVDTADLAGFTAGQLPASLAKYGLATAVSGVGNGSVIPEPSSLAAAIVAAGLLTCVRRNSSRLRRA